MSRVGFLEILKHACYNSQHVYVLFIDGIQFSSTNIPKSLFCLLTMLTYFDKAHLPTIGLFDPESHLLMHQCFKFPVMLAPMNSLNLEDLMPLFLCHP